MRYATLEEMQGMEFGVTGLVKQIDGVEFEMLRNEYAYGWAAKNGELITDQFGTYCNMVDWDRVDEEEAKRLGLI